jgi:hypothetical protein
MAQQKQGALGGKRRHGPALRLAKWFFGTPQPVWGSVAAYALAFGLRSTTTREIVQTVALLAVVVRSLAAEGIKSFFVRRLPEGGLQVGIEKEDRPESEVEREPEPVGPTPPPERDS